ncbi:hypothetical protein OSB04_029620 [Centaurea solstitialis]|uniref:Uncharacterized protein n=1 Tax=Centaurea solstitialis TaxID=347529 RepID=A0AA38VSF2_9ASTR|nr:hypothetical protein OSB04_029620 [Centaurea solstitialis]
MMFDDTDDLGLTREKRSVVLGRGAKSHNLAGVDDVVITKSNAKLPKRKGKKKKKNSPPTSHGPHDVDVSLPPFGPKSSSDARNKFREALRLFHAIYRKILQGEEARTTEGEESSKRGRVDLKAKSILQEKGKAPDRGKKTWGSIPGVDVGDEFQYRVELALVGLHWTLQSGIDYIRKGKELIATSVVAAGGYDNELGNPDCLTYSGSGGIGKDKKVENQKLEKGNLALKNNIDTKIPVRVIRGYKSKSTDPSDSRPRPMTTYIYDGLYTVDKYYQEPGQLVIWFINLSYGEFRDNPSCFAGSQVEKIQKTGRCLCRRYNRRQRGVPIWQSTQSTMRSPFFRLHHKDDPSRWVPSCSPERLRLRRSVFRQKMLVCFQERRWDPYNRNGAIVEAKPSFTSAARLAGALLVAIIESRKTVFEFDIFRKFYLRVYRRASRRHGSRETNRNDEYLFDIGQNYNDCTKPAPGEVVEGDGFTIDAAHFGNVGRFINHSCSPNLYAQNVLYDEEDKRMPHIMLFAAENIPPLQELTYHYNYAVDTVHDSDGNIKIKSCYCGSSECTGRLY